MAHQQDAIQQRLNAAKEGVSQIESSQSVILAKLEDLEQVLDQQEGRDPYDGRQGLAEGALDPEYGANTSSESYRRMLAV